ncbi:MAG: EAL domain-containing protein [Gallionella sp.]
MPTKSANPKQLLAENAGLRTRVEKAEATLREILSGDADALFVSGEVGAQMFTLKGADQTYRTLIENMSEGALTLTPDGLILYANRCFAGMLGMPLEKVIGSEIYTWFPPVSRQALQTLLRKDALDNHREELALAAADGTTVPVSLSVSRLHQDGITDAICMIATDLSEQKRNEAILAADKLAHAILEQAADAIVICDETGRIIRASKQAQSFYGQDMVGQIFEQAFPLRQPDGTAFLSVGAIDTSHRQSVEAGLSHNGQGVDFLVSVGHLKGTRNELLGSVVTLTDITERKQAEEHLKLFRTLLDHSSDAIEVIDPLTMRFIDVNKTACSSLGYSREEMLAMSMFDIDTTFTTETAKTVGAQIRQAGSVHFETVHRRKDGSTFTVEVNSTRVELDKPYLVAVARDITERKRSEESLLKLSLAVEQSSHSIVITGLDANIEYVNSAFYDITGYSQAEVIGQNPRILHSGKTPKTTYDDMWAHLTNGQGWKGELINKRKDGSEYTELVRISPIRQVDGKVSHYLAIQEDITERKAAEARVIYLNRVYAVLSGVNALIVRTHDLDELFREVCRIAVEVGGFSMAWVGIVDPSTMKMVLIASAGVDEETLTAIKNIYLSSESAPTQDTMVGQAMSDKKSVVSNDLKNDPKASLGKKHAASGIFSMAILPLIVSDKALGALVFYADEIEFFHDEEMTLLAELTGDIAFAIDHIKKQERLNYLAYYDVLTGLANRPLFLDRVTQYMRSAANGGYKLALCLIDLERFKNINDSLGRLAGDALLKQVAEWLTHNTGDANLLAHINADHFVMVLPEVNFECDLTRQIEKMSQAFQEHLFPLNDAVFRIAAKAGIALFPDDGTDADTLFRNAEVALKRAKASGDRYLFYTQKMTEAMAGKLTMENQLRQAIDNEEFVLHYQPKVNMVSGKVTGAEALIRWNDPRTGLVPPGRFIPLLEETGLIYEVGRWAMHQAIEDNLRWRNAGLPAVRIAVNVSALQLRSPGFIAEIEQALAIDTHAAEGLEVEITESLIMEDVNRNISSLQAIRDIGVTIAIDDFGTGFSSLGYLSKLPVDTLKIDRSFVIEMTVGPEGLALVSTIISLAHALHLKVVAEGVETEEQAHLLSLLSCDEMQGFLFSKPVPAEIFEAKFLMQLPVG